MQDPVPGPSRKVADEPGTPRRGRLVLFTLALAQLTVILDGTIVTTAMPAVQADLGPGSGAYLLTAYTVPFGGLLLLGGRLSDHLGHRRMFIAGLLGLIGASVLAALAPGLAWLAAARALQGASAALLSPAALALIDSTFITSRDRARAFGVFGAVSGAGSAAGFVIGGLVVDLAGWRWCLVAGVPFAAAAAAMATRQLTESRRNLAGRSALLPGLLVTVGLAVLVHGLARAATIEADGLMSWSTEAAALLAPGVGLLVLFVVLERRSSAPLVSRSLWGSGTRRTAFLVSGVASAGLTASFPLMALYLTGLGLAPWAVALAFLPCSVTSFVTASFVGALLDRVHPATLMGTGTLLGVAGLLVLASAGAGSGYVTVVLPGLVLTSIAGSLVFTPLPALVLQDVHPDDRGVASAMVTVTQQVGGALGTAVLLAVGASGSAPGRAGADLAGDADQYAVTLPLAAAAAVVLLAAAVLARLRGTARADLLARMRATARATPRAPAEPAGPTHATPPPADISPRDQAPKGHVHRTRGRRRSLRRTARGQERQGPEHRPGIRSRTRGHLHQSAHGAARTCCLAGEYPARPVSPTSRYGGTSHP